MSLLTSFIDWGLRSLDKNHSNINAVDAISASAATKGKVVMANQDVFVGVMDRDEGYVEICVAKEGDPLEIVEIDSSDEEVARVINTETGDVVSVPLKSMDEY